MRYILFLSLFLISPLSKATLQHSTIDAIYGIDDREIISSKTDSKILELSRSVSFIVTSDSIETSLFKSIIKNDKLQKLLNLCSKEKFSTVPGHTGCTGFLVSEDTILSAGHCFLTESDCANKKIIFDVYANKQTRDGYSIPKANIFSCKKIIAQEAGGEQDYSIVQLDRAPKNRMPLKLNLKAKTADDARVFMIGHPLGMPLTYSKTTSIISNEEQFIFKTPLDSFEGNSGSPVINAKTFEVEGILVNGQQDLVQDPLRGCYRNAQYDESAGNEGAFRVNQLPPF